MPISPLMSTAFRYLCEAGTWSDGWKGISIKWAKSVRPFDWGAFSQGCELSPKASVFPLGEQSMRTFWWARAKLHVSSQELRLMLRL